MNRAGQTSTRSAFLLRQLDLAGANVHAGGGPWRTVAGENDDRTRRHVGCSVSSPIMRSLVSGGGHCACAASSIVAATLLVVAVLAPTACMVGPDFVKPKVSLNARWSSDPRLQAEAAIDVAWWKGFKDPTLDRLIDLAYRQNLSLQIAGLRILEARAQLGIAFGDQFPKGGANAGAAAVGITDNAADFVGGDRRFAEFDVGFDAVWELDFWGKYRRGVRAARASYLATVADYDDAIAALSAEVARTYVVIRTFEVLIEQTEQNAKLQQEGVDIAESRFRNGATSELDVAQARSLLETTRASIPPLQIGLHQARNALSTLLGRPPGYVQSLLGERAVIPTPPVRAG